MRRDVAKRCIDLTYQEIDLNPPDTIVWCQSPLAAVICSHLVEPGSNVFSYNYLCQKFNEKLRITADSVLSQELSTELRQYILKGTRGVLEQRTPGWAKQRNNLLHKNQISDQVWSGVSDSLWEADLGTSWDKQPNAIDDLDCLDMLETHMFGGSLEAYRLCYYWFCSAYLGLNLGLDNFCSTTVFCGKWLPYEHVCFVSERPMAVTLTTGTWADGFQSI